jgi:Flp pilus assembly protein TadG
MTIRHPSRRGAAMVEAAVVLGVFLTLLLGSLDLALAVLRSNALAEAARRLTRAAIVRGEDATAVFTPWGPTSCQGTANDGSEYADAFRDALIVAKLSEVKYRLEWPDGNNDAGDRVQATITSKYAPILPSLFGSTPYNLQAVSTMRIEH